MSAYDVCGQAVDLDAGEWPVFIGFIAERARILARKRLGWTPPLTNNPILSAGKFGNVWRHADRGTIWELDRLTEWESRVGSTPDWRVRREQEQAKQRPASNVQPLQRRGKQ